MRENQLSYNNTMEISALQPGTYIVAVSGGVDSMVLLDSLVKANFTDVRLVVAHANHGIRPDAREDRYLVEQFAKDHQLTFEFTSLLLGKNPSEDQARTARHAFLQELKQKHSAQVILTAHHRDDMIETALMNLRRGTGWRGIASLRDTTDYLRPLLSYSKKELYAYAKTYQVHWREDSTNTDLKYHRNVVRHQLLPMLEKNDPVFIESLYALIKKQVTLRPYLEQAIEDFSKLYVNQRGLQLDIYRRLDGLVAVEVLRWFMRSQGVFLTRPQLERLAAFTKKANRNQKHSLTTGIFACRRDGLLVVERG